MPDNIVKKPVVAIVGGDTLLGRELREALSSSSLPITVELIAAVGEAGVFTEDLPDAPVINPLNEEHLAAASIAFLAGSPAASRKAARIAAELKPGPVLIDLTYALEDRPNARLRAPLLEPVGFQVPPDAIHSIAHPAATALATVFERLHKRHPVRHSVANILEPASERGQRGLDELQQQTVGLLSFKPLTKDFFDAQIAFNLLPRYGSEAMEPLEEVETRIDLHLATLLSHSGPAHAPMPSLRLTQAPVFHGYSISLWIEFEENPGVKAVEQALASAQIEVRTKDDEPPNNVGAAGQSGLIAGLIEVDHNHPRAVWLWLVADNLRVAAEAARGVARTLLESHAL